jgi:hypothetical protein
MGVFRRLLTHVASIGLRSSLEKATPDDAVAFLVPEEAYLSIDADHNTLRVGDAARGRLMTFPSEVRLLALLSGLERKEAHVRAACAALLLHNADTRVLAVFRRHIDDPDPRVAWRANFHVEHYGVAGQDGG